MGDAKKDKLAIAGLAVAAIGTIATIAALWGPIFARDRATNAPGDGRGMFRVPAVVWREGHGLGNLPPVKVGYQPEGHEVLGFSGILDEDEKRYAESSCGGGSEVVTIHDVDHVPNTNIPYGFIGEAVTGDRIVFELDSRLPERMSRVEASWISSVVRERRRAVVTYIMCGTARVGKIDQILAE